MESGGQLLTAPCTSILCQTCHHLGKVKPGSVVNFGNLNTIKSREPCSICYLASLAIQNHRRNRLYEADDRLNESFAIVPIHDLPEHREHGDDCVCHCVLRIDSRFYTPSRPIGVIRHFPSGLPPRLSVEEDSQTAPSDESSRQEHGIKCLQEDGLVDFPSIRSWLRECETEHDSCKILGNLGSSSVPRLLLIDVEASCLVEAPAPRYVALSYVWGAAAVFKTLKSNLSSLCEEGALTSLGDKIPLLIRDAILIVRGLGERFLWVDSLCIVQDDDSSKHDLISMMDIIYSEAVCTIITHGSVNASSSIPGVRQNTRSPGRIMTGTEQPAGTGVFVSAPFHYAADPNVYDTRGWTFQEQILSRRRLIFGADQVFFSCQSQPSGDWCEDSLTGTSVSTHNGPIQHLNEHGSVIAMNPNLNLDITGVGDMWRAQRAILELSRLGADPAHIQDQLERAIFAYTSAVTFYSSRQLTYQSDILNAFYGVMNSLERACGLDPRSSVCGLLEKYIQHNLHWISKKGIRRHNWPSWSWVGWNSQIHWVERNGSPTLELQIQDVYFFNRGEVRTITNTLTTTDHASRSHGEGPCEIPADRHNSLLRASEDVPIIAFWATVVGPEVLKVRCHPIRTTRIRIWESSVEQCGHMHEEYGYSSGLTSDVLERCRLVYLSWSSQNCVFHAYRGECVGSCNVMVVDPGDTDTSYATRIGIGEVCGNTWKEIQKHREFVALA